MAVYYKRATPAQRDQLRSDIQIGPDSHIRQSAARFRRREASSCCRPIDRATQPDRDSVKMEVHSKEGKIYPVIYSMRLGDDGSWRMYNIIINGINIGLTYRNQFASAMKAPENHKAASMR